MSNTVKHKTLPAGTDRPGFAGITPSLYAEEHAFAGGNLGSVLIRNAGNSDGSAWVGSAQGVLASAGTNLVPAFTTAIPNSTATFTATSGSQPVRIGSGAIDITGPSTTHFNIFLDNSIYAGSSALNFLDVENVSGIGANPAMSLVRLTSIGVNPATYAIVPPSAAIKINIGDATVGRVAEVNSIITRSSSGYLERSRTVALGEWTHVAFNSANFSTDTGGVTWTQPNDANYAAFEYMQVGKTMFVNISLLSGTISGACGYLKLTIPGTITKDWVQFAQIYNGAAYSGSIMTGTVGDTFIRIYKDAGFTGWGAMAATAAVRGNVFFQIN